MDIAQALKDGYSEDEVAQELVRRGIVPEIAGRTGMDYSAARRDNYEDFDIAREVVRRTQAGKPPAEKSGVVEGAAKAAATGVVKGLAGLAGTPGDVLAGFDRGMKSVARKTTGGDFPFWNPFPTSEEVMGMAKRRGFSPYQPQRDVERYIESGGVGAGAMGPGGLATLGPRVATGAGIGVVGQAGEDVGGPVGRLFAELIAGVGPMYAASRKPNIIKTLEDDIKDVGESGLREAQAARTATEKTLGTPVLLPQGNERLTSMSGTLSEILRSPAGAYARRVLERQTPVGQDKIDDLIRALTKRDLGQNEANRVAYIGANAFEAPAQDARRVTKPLYDRANDIPVRESVVSREIPDLIEAAKKNRYLDLPASDSGREMTATAKKLKEGGGTYAGLVDERGVPFRKPVLAGSLDTVKKEANLKAGKVDEPSKKLGREGTAGAIRDKLYTEVPEMESAARVHRMLQEGLVDPVQKGILGKTFPKEIRESGVGNWETFGKVLDSPRDVSSDIRFLAANLRRADATKESFAQIVKANWLDKWEALKVPDRGRVDQNAVGEWVGQVFGAKNSDRRKNVMASIEEIAKDHGKDPVAARQGAEALSDALQVISRDRSALGQVSGQEMVRASGENLPSRLLRMMNLFAPTYTLGTALERAVHRRTYEQIADAFTSPDGVEKLIAIAKYSQPKAAANAAARGLILLKSQEQAESY